MGIFHQKNQPFTTIDLIGVIVMVGIVGSISGAILAESFRNERPWRAQMAAHALASEIRSTRLAMSPSHSHARGPASLSDGGNKIDEFSGERGRDPWGRPFHFFVQNSGATSRVYVWSAGPDGKSDSNPSSESSQQFQASPYRGDDIGVVEELRRADQ